MQTEATIKGLGIIKYSCRPFDQALEELGRNPITARNLAYARTQVEPSHSLNQNGSYIREGDLYTKNPNQIILLRNSLILKHPKDATQSHRESKEYKANSKEVQKVLDLASSKSNLVFILKNTNPIPTNDFKNHPLTEWLFQDMAEDYGLFLKDKGKISEMPLIFDSQDHIAQQGNPYANQLWLGGFDDQSGLGGGGRNLNGGSWVRGVFRKRPEGSLKIFSHSPTQKPMYTQREIQTVLKRARNVHKDLGEVIKFLEKLKQ